jgi:ribosome maturation factor RimP
MSESIEVFKIEFKAVTNIKTYSIVLDSDNYETLEDLKVAITETLEFLQENGIIEGLEILSKR